MNGSKSNLGPLLIILATLIAAVLGYWWQTGNWPEILRPHKESTYTLSSTAPAGTLIEGFPKEFVSLARDAAIVESTRSVDASGATERLRTIYETAARPSDLFAAYLDLFSGEDYELKYANASGGVTVINVEGKEGLVAVTLEKGEKKTSRAELTVTRPVIK